MRTQQMLLLLAAVSAAAAELKPLPGFAKAASGLQIVAPCVPGMPWTVAGEHGALLGRQNGKFEAWQWPVKILSDFRIRAELADYAVPIEVNPLAAQISVTPAETTITYSHAAFTVRQHMFARRGEDPAGAGASVFFEIESARPLELTFSFTPEMLRMWPAPNHGRPNGEWSNGHYILHTDDESFSAVVAMPHTRPGILVPYQEHPQTYPLELKLSFDPKKDAGLVFPLVMQLGNGSPEESLTSLPALYAKTQEYYAHFFDRRLTSATPDSRLDEALKWAELAVDQAQVKYHDETGLVAGYYESADSARPGYAWFFGRDTLWTTYAINSYGDFSLTRRALEFLIRRQREDGKIMHEYSQSADALDWKQTPYFYASADATPLLIMAMADFVRTSGDIEFLRTNWSAIRRAYAFTRAHEANDGIYANSEGTGWVESWPSGMPKEEIYLAALDQQSARAMARLALLMNEKALAEAARAKAAGIASKIENEYHSAGFYAFSRNSGGSLDQTASIYPAVAWWDGTFSLKAAGPMLSRWASHEFSSDWGTRDISEQTPFYDPISYHQGSIWPLFTGWVSLAEYRAGRPLSGYAHLMQNAGLTWTQDLGSVTELLSGEFFQPLGRSSSHQLWSSAMVISPMLRGLFGLDWDAPNHTLRIAPHLPADWEFADLDHVPFGQAMFRLHYKRMGGHLQVTATSDKPEQLCLMSESLAECESGPPQRTHTIALPLPPVEIAIPGVLPAPGSMTGQLKVLDGRVDGNRAIFRLEASGGASYDLPVRINRQHVTVAGGELREGKLHVRFPAGSGYQQQLITFTW